jgi:glucose/mannose-6-phosphate isomerase
MTLVTLDKDSIEGVDREGMLGDVLAQPLQLGDALWRAQSAEIRPRDLPGGLVVCGMGGSAIGGDLAIAALGDRATRPITTVRGYALESWTGPDSLVLCASYSGNTEETLACYEAAGVIGARRVVVTSGGKLADLARADQVPVVPVAGGFQPRAAVAYMTVAALQVAALCGVGPGMNSELDVAADHLEELVIEWGPEGPPDGLAKTLARSLHGTIPVIAGAGLTTPIAYRWKTQANENAKIPAYALELPELDHNEIVGWGSAADFARFSAVFLDDCDTHPRVKERIDLTARLVAPGAAGVHRVESRGQNTAERVFSLVLLGDLVSVYLAALRGVDPEPVELLDRLKAELDGHD